MNCQKIGSQVEILEHLPIHFGVIYWRWGATLPHRCMYLCEVAQRDLSCYILLSTYVCMCIYIYMYAYLYIHMYVCKFIDLYIYKYICICIYLYNHVCDKQIYQCMLRIYYILHILYLNFTVYIILRKMFVYTLLDILYCIALYYI